MIQADDLDLLHGTGLDKLGCETRNDEKPALRGGQAVESQIAEVRGAFRLGNKQIIHTHRAENDVTEDPLTLDSPTDDSPGEWF